MIKTRKGIAVLLLVAILFSMNITSIFAAETSEPKVYTKGTNTLNLEGTFTANGSNGAIWVKEGAQLTINGTDKTEVHGALGADNYSMAVWAKGEDTRVVINGGYYTNETDGSKRGTDLIYASAKAVIEINGGTFKAAKEEWTLNGQDNSGSQIIVKGGTFYKFDPSNNAVGAGEVVVPEGYEVVKNGDWYSVYTDSKVYTKGTNTLNLEGTFTANGSNGAIWVKEGAQLTINGTDKTEVHGALGADNYSMAVWAKGEDTRVVINGGYYTNETDGSKRGTDLIYASAKAVIEINGGTFKAAKEEWTLNGQDNSGSQIIVKGGTFYKFDPSNNTVGAGEVVVPEGYRVIKDGDWYSVCEIKETEAEVSDKVANAEKVEEMVIKTLEEVVVADSELAKAIEGKSIEVEVEVKPVEVNKSEKETIETEAAKKVEDIKVAKYIDISIVVKDADTDEEITKLSTVKEAIKFTVEVPSELKSNIPEGYTRIFYIIRNHNGAIDVWETKEVDGKLSFESDKFSTYAIAYKDVEIKQHEMELYVHLGGNVEYKSGAYATKDGITVGRVGEKVCLKVTPDEGYEVILTIKDEDGNSINYDEDYSFVMPDKKIFIEAEFTEILEKEDTTVESGEGEAIPQPEVKPTSPDVPKTGDNVIVFASIALVAIAGIVIAIKMRKK